MRRRLRFDLDGTAFATERAGRIIIHTLAGTPRWSIDSTNVVDCDWGRDELWVVRDQPAVLQRLHREDGRVLSTVAIDPVDARGWMQVSIASPSLPTWCGPGARVLRPDSPLAKAPAADLVVPLTEQRCLIWSNGMLRSWREGGEDWRIRVGDPGAPLVAAQVVADGRLFAFAQRRLGASELKVHVVATRDGTLHTVVHLPHAADVRFAARRGFVVARTTDRLTVVDLRFGRLVREHALAEDVIDVAVDDGFRTIALLDDTEQVRLVSAETMSALASELGAATPARAPTPPAIDEVVVEPPAPTTRRRTPRATPTEVAGRPDVERPFDDIPLTRLAPVIAATPATRDEADLALEARLQWVGACALVAIADAWNTGRLVHADPSGLPYADEVAGILRSRTGLAADKVATAEAGVRAAAALVAITDRQRDGRVTGLDVLVRDFGLSPIAEQILLVACGPQLRGDYARLYGIVANDPSRALVDEQLVYQLLGGGMHQIAGLAHALDADQPLRKFGLLTVGDGSRLFASLTVDPVVLRAITGQPFDGEPDRHLVVRRADRSLEDLQIPARLVHDAVAFLARPDPRPCRIVVRGRAGRGRHTLLASLAARAGRALGIIDMSAMPRERGQHIRALEIALRRAALRGLVPCVDGLELTTHEDPDSKIQIGAVLRDHAGPLAIRLASDAPILLEAGYLLLDIPSSSEQERSESWTIALGRYGLLLDEADELAARYRVGPGTIDRICAELASHGSASRSAIEDTTRRHLETRLTATASRVARLASWSDVVLPEDVLDSLLELTARVRHRKKVFETWGFDRSLTSARGITALFSGGPGTGKTMVAGAIARDLGLELYRVDVARITSKWIGETEKNLASLFDAAEDGQVMLLFDEADSLFAKRTEVKSSVDRYANMEVNYLLQRLDTFEGIAILTTNFGTAIDPAFKRRLSFRVTFPFPDEEMRERLWKTLIPSATPLGGAIDFARLSQRFQLSGGYIRNAALRSAFLAAEEDSPLLEDHIERAIRMEFREIGKLAESGVLE